MIASRIASPPRRLLEAEASRREEFRQALRRAILAGYVVDAADAEGPGRYCVRRLEVYRTVAEQLRIRLVTAPFANQVVAAAAAMGAIPVRVGRRRLFRGMHRRELCPAQAAAESTAMRAAFTARPGHRAAPYNGNGTRGTRGTGGKASADYSALLAAEGMPAELEAVGLVDRARASINGLRIAKATDAFWEVDRLHAILRLYMDGCSIRDIVERTGLSRKVVHNRLKEQGLTTVEEEGR